MPIVTPGTLGLAPNADLARCCCFQRPLVGRAAALGCPLGSSIVAAAYRGPEHPRRELPDTSQLPPNLQRRLMLLMGGGLATGIESIAAHAPAAHAVSPPATDASLLPSAQPSTGSNTLCVAPSGGSGCYGTITEAINAATGGAVIKIAPGVYRERIILKDSITLQAEPKVADG